MAEGVEIEAQLRILRALGSHLIQGCLSGSPMSDAAIGQYHGGSHRLLSIAASQA